MQKGKSQGEKKVALHRAGRLEWQSTLTANLTMKTHYDPSHQSTKIANLNVVWMLRFLYKAPQNVQKEVWKALDVVWKTTTMHPG